MSKPIEKIRRFILWFFATIVAGGSLTGCGMYGPPPRSYYTINGKVIQRDSKEGIKNVKITIHETNDSIFTSKDGSFKIENKELIGKESITIEVEDIDGMENGGEFSSKTVKITDYRRKEIGIELEHKDDL